MQGCVVDASVALKWVIPEPDSDRATALHQASLYAPDLLLVEAANALWARVRRQLMSSAEAEAAFAMLRAAPMAFTPMEHLSAPALTLAIELGQPVYDCCYLALAIARNVPLVTADQKLLLAIEGTTAARFGLPLDSLA